jgi:uncharacterized protein (TIGR03083 family)
MDVDPLEALRAECEGVSRTALEIAEEDFARPTRLPAWNVKELLAHMYHDIDRTNVALTQAAPERADADGVSYWRTYDPATDGPDIADRAKAAAAKYDTGQRLATAWDEMWRRALELAAGADRGRVVVTWGPALTLEEFMRTRVLEMTVHGLDLRAALDLVPDPTGAGLAITAGILRGLLGRELPPGLWDDITFVEKGTGRQELTGAERVALGELAGSFPLLQ